MKLVRKNVVMGALALLAGCTDLLPERTNASVEIPDGWTCSRDLWQDGRCTCGCGVQDVDCSANDRTLCKAQGCKDVPGELIHQVPSAADPRVCVPTACGDGYVEMWDENCDDGDATDAGGCSADCNQENEGWRCGNNGEGCVQEICGNGIYDYGEEQCDDGNTAPGDGCDATCNVEDGWACALPEDIFGWMEVTGPCTPTVCGDGLLQNGEECDEGDVVGGDGCSATCTVEEGFVCHSDGCRPIECGDDIFDHEDGELCDDGNTQSDDGCSANCRPETCTAEDAAGECTAWAVLPLAWDVARCPTYMFGDDGTCTCGCGARDVDCPDGALELEACENDGCDHGVDPADPLECLTFVPHCGDVWMCLFDCAPDDAACDAACRENADAATLGLDAALWECSADQCAQFDRDDEDQDGWSALMSCHDDRCEPALHACQYDAFRHTAPACGLAHRCAMDCPDGQDRSALCTGQLGDWSHRLFDRLEECRAAECGDIDPDQKGDDGLATVLGLCLRENCRDRFDDCESDDGEG